MRVIIKTKCPLYEFLVFTKDIKPGLMLCKTNIFFLEWATFMSSEYWLGLKEATWSDAAVSQNWRKKLNIKFLSFFSQITIYYPLIREPRTVLVFSFTC